VIQLDLAERRKAIVSAISSAVPTRFMGCFFCPLFFDSESKSRAVRGVSVRVGVFLLKSSNSQRKNLVIPLRRNRKKKKDYDKYLYKLRHFVENAIQHLKSWKEGATRCAKNTDSFLAAI